MSVDNNYNNDIAIICWKIRQTGNTKLCLTKFIFRDERQSISFFLSIYEVRILRIIIVYSGSAIVR